jgi:hypothetical protein
MQKAPIESGLSRNPGTVGRRCCKGLGRLSVDGARGGDLNARGLLQGRQGDPERQKSAWGKRTTGDIGGIVISSNAVWGQCASRRLRCQVAPSCGRKSVGREPLEAFELSRQRKIPPARRATRTAIIVLERRATRNMQVMPQRG